MEDTKAAQKAAFKVALPTSAVAAGSLFKNPWVLPPGNPIYKILSKVFTVTMFMALNAALILLVLAAILPKSQKAICISKMLMWVSLALLQIAFVLGIYITLTLA